MEGPKLKLYLYHCTIAAIAGLITGAANLKPAVAFSTYIAVYLASTAVIATAKKVYIKALQKLGDFYKPAAMASLLIFLTCWIMAYNVFQGFPTVIFIDPSQKIGHFYVPSVLSMGYNCYYVVSCHEKKATILLGRSIEITENISRLYIPHAKSGIIFSRENCSIKLFSTLHLELDGTASLPWCGYEAYYSAHGVSIASPSGNLTVSEKPIEIESDNITLRVMLVGEGILMVESTWFTIPECSSLNLTSFGCFIMLRDNQLLYFPSEYTLTPAARLDKGVFLYLKEPCESSGG